ncbi:MAG TPA: DinB family protein [Dehalococcoidia bacterium]|nr:DinB family protein [Dehalococcoidia bacterium]
MGDTAEKTIDEIRRNRERFEAFVRSLSEEQLSRQVPDSTWSVRDFVAHLGTLDPALERWFERAAAGERFDNGLGEDGGRFDIDDFNEAQVLARRTWPIEQVLAEAAQNRARLIAALSELGEDAVKQEMRFAGDAKRAPGTWPFALFLAGWAQHDPIHAADMLRALPELQDDEDLRAWTSNPFVQGYQRIMNPGHGEPRA